MERPKIMNVLLEHIYLQKKLVQRFNCERQGYRIIYCQVAGLLQADTTQVDGFLLFSQLWCDVPTHCLPAGSPSLSSDLLPFLD